MHIYIKFSISIYKDSLKYKIQGQQNIYKGVKVYMIIGVDAGYYATKTSEGIVFPSRISTVENILGENNNIVIDNKRYTVGEGEVTVDFNKINNELTKVCILYALAKSSPGVDFDIVTGLPVDQFKNQKDELKEMLQGVRINRIEVGGQKRTIIINKVEVFPQGAGALYSTSIDGDVVLVDIGGRTVDICYFEVVSGKRKLVKHSTIYEGTLSLYSKIVNLINTKYETDLKLEDGEKVLRNGLEIFGVKQNLVFLRDIIHEHCERITKELILNYPVKTSKVPIAGGGGMLLKGVIESKIPNCTLIPYAQFANANGFKKVGESLWQKY